jgi:hypothetical protein
MLIIPLYILLFLYFLFLAGFFSFMIINVYHIVEGGVINLPSFIVTLVICLGALAVLNATYLSLAGSPWQSALTTIDLRWFGNFFSL